MQGNEWIGESDDKSDSGRAALYATMLEKVARKGDLPEAPNEIGEKTLTEVIEEKLGRGLTGEEDEYLGKIERRFRRFELEREIFDSDLVRLNPRWPVESYEPLILWPTPPRDIIEFWNYIAHAFEKGNYPIPAFLEVITDREWTQERMASWNGVARRASGATRSRSSKNVLRGRGRAGRVPPPHQHPRSAPHGPPQRLGRLRAVADAEQFKRLEERYANGGLRMKAGSEILWSKFIHAAAKEESNDGGLSLDRLENCRLLNRLFHQRELEGLIVNLDEQPFRLSEKPLRWICRPDSMGTEHYELQLITGENDDVSHTLRLLPGDEALYMSDEWVFPAPSIGRAAKPSSIPAS